ncbi:MAG TPA: replication initiator protein A [Geminicoccus sp.]|jgi:hypothetical protein|uniref:replication initiator protein A n=1 Tax=Geminicoccus sp. TaxID=2024832 RepID=UPI002E34F38C|nr:replication initiator protein A [Geminicoccus sp.]HEX2524899.1 replication initiator protein A [Geminicoccus sp.]
MTIQGGGEPEPTPQFFVCDLFDVTWKGDMASMEHPIFSLSTKPDHRLLRYENGPSYVEIQPSYRGLATIHDRDLLIYCISQLMAALNAGREVFPVLRFHAKEMLKATNRQTSGEGYADLKASLERLRGTQIVTNIVTGGVEQYNVFGLIDKAETIRETRDGRMQMVEIRLSDWVYNAVVNREVLTLHPDYFLLRRPLERRIYELARKHCGRNPEWRMPLATLQEKCGSGSASREFRRMVREIVKKDIVTSHMPDYAITLDKGDMVVFRNRDTMPKLPKAAQADNGPTVPPLDAETYHDARIAAPGWDVYFIEKEWRDFIAMTGMPPTNPDLAFIGFCRKWYEKRGVP